MKNRLTNLLFPFLLIFLCFCTAGCRNDKQYEYVTGLDGKDGNGILSIEKTDTNGLSDIYTIYFSNGSEFSFSIKNGDNGQPGSDGQNGINGENGKTAYELACEAGFTGSVDEWLDQLRGEKGDPGQNGTVDYSRLTPFVGANGNWWIGTDDIGVKVSGTNGLDGKDGIGITAIDAQTQANNVVLTITLSDGSKSTFTIPLTESLPEGTDGLAYYPLPDGTYSVSCGNTTYLSEIRIPQTHNGKIVSRIEGSAFQNCTNLERIYLPDGMTTIGACAFENCTNLSFISIPDSMINISGLAFRGANSLQYNSFRNGLYLGNEINPYVAFVKLSYRDNFELHEKTKVIVGSAFSGYDFETFALPDGVQGIGEYAFSNCSKLQEIYIPDSVVYIGNSAFQNCSSLTNCFLPKSIEIIETSTFNGCNNLNSIIIPNSVKTIEGYAFCNCGHLSDVTFGNNVASIGDLAFYGCNTTSIILPNSLTSIGYCAFWGWYSLESITYQGTLNQWNAILKDKDWDRNTPKFTVYCSDGIIVKDYQA